MNDLYKRIDEAINSRTRKTKVETLVTKEKELLSTAIDNNDQQVQLASRHPNIIKLTEDLELWLKEAINTHGNYVANAREYIELSDETIGESTFCRKTSSRGSKTVSISSSQRRREQEIARLQREEIERETENITKLAQQKHQLELDTISEESRKKLFDAKVKEIRAMELSDDSLDGANNILSTIFCSNRTENECKKMVSSKLRTHYRHTKRIIS